MFENIDIKKVKEELRNHSKNYRENFNKIEKFINELSLNLVHVHANNFRPLREDDDLPFVLELTFSKHSNVSTDYNLPHKLDMPNNKNGMEYEILINDK